MSQVAPIKIENKINNNKDCNEGPFSPPADGSFDFAG